MRIATQYPGACCWCQREQYGPYSKIILVVGLNQSVGSLKEQWKGFLCFAGLKVFSGLSRLHTHLFPKAFKGMHISGLRSLGNLRLMGWGAIFHRENRAFDAVCSTVACVYVHTTLKENVTHSCLGITGTNVSLRVTEWIHVPVFTHSCIRSLTKYVPDLILVLGSKW